MKPPDPTSDRRAPTYPFGLDYQIWNHAALFYLEEAFLVRILCQFIGASLRAGDGAVIVATDGHAYAIEQTLIRSGIDVVGLKRKGSYVELNADRTLANHNTGGKLDLERLNLLIDETISGANEATGVSASRLTVFGELVALLWARRDFEGVLAVELLWENLAKRFPFSLLCGYPIQEFAGDGTEEFLRICAEHSIVIPPDAYPTPEAEKKILQATARSSGAAPSQGRGRTFFRKGEVTKH